MKCRASEPGPMQPKYSARSFWAPAQQRTAGALRCFRRTSGTYDY